MENNNDTFDVHYHFLLKKFGDKIQNRIEVLWNEALKVLEKMNMDKVARIDKESFYNAVLDYFTDIARLKEMHNITKTNMVKIYAYEMYWLLRRRPIHLVKDTKDSFDLNEKVIISIFIPKILEEVGIPYSKDPHNKEIEKHLKVFTNLLFYNFKYRQYSPQSLELMIEAFICGCAYADAAKHEEKD